MIKLDKVEFQYSHSNFKLNISNLEIDSGSKVAILGPSGYGKTTLLNLISGILLPDSGKVHTTGYDLTTLNEEQRRNFRISNIGFIFQDFELIEYLDVFDNIALPFLISPTIKLDNQVTARLEQLSSNFGLSDKLKRNVNRLSQGEKQRVAICRAILIEPDLLLADEPTGNLDPENKKQTIESLINYSNDTGATLVVVTHDHSYLNLFDKSLDLTEILN